MGPEQDDTLPLVKGVKIGWRPSPSSSRSEIDAMARSVYDLTSSLRGYHTKPKFSWHTFRGAATPSKFLHAYSPCVCGPASFLWEAIGCVVEATVRRTSHSWLGGRREGPSCESRPSESAALPQARHTRCSSPFPPTCFFAFLAPDRSRAPPPIAPGVASVRMMGVIRRE